MTSQWEMLAQGGFQFFGKMSASISHEIKNALAIINEKAGLLEDFTVLAGQGRPIDPERLKALAGQILKQIQRADGLVKRLNRLAHSADDPLKTIDLREALELIAAIAQRLVAMREARLDLILPEQPVTVATNPFLLENLIWSGLEFLLTENHKTVTLSLETVTGAGARVRLIGQFPFPGDRGESFPAEKEKALLQALQVELQIERQSGEIVFLLKPKR
jgi:C4-dicarboxylate-specific signal transduction histidine kinase